MFPRATLFLDVCVQRELWPGGPWPLVTSDVGRNVVRLCALAGALPVRRGSILCRHDDDGAVAAPGSPAHACGSGALARPEGCVLVGEAVESGCGVAPDDAALGPAFGRLTAGIRDAVVFGAGIEYGLALAMAALLRGRVRTHLVLDAAGAADEIAAQLVIADFKRRGVDVMTVDMVARLLRRG